MPIGPLKNLFGSKKEDFFLEIGDSQSTSPTPAAPVAQPTVTPAPAATTAPAAPAPLAPAAKATKTSIKAAKAEAKPKPVELPKPAPAAPTLPAETAFASKFVPANTPRRRPGPSLSPFMDMARGMGR